MPAGAQYGREGGKRVSEGLASATRHTWFKTVGACTCYHTIIDHLRLRDLSDKAVNVAAGLGKSGIAKQEGLIAQLGSISKACDRIRDECFVFSLGFTYIYIYIYI